MTPAGARTFDLDRFLGAERRRVEAALARFVEGLPDARPAEAIRYALEAGGKRLRPILLVASYRAATDGAEPAAAVYDLAVSVELIHTYSLIHDDLPCMDDDDVRRGRPSTHRAFDVETGMRAGLAMIPLACLAVEQAGAALGLDADVRMRLVGELCTAAGGGGMVGGQVLDLEAEHRAVALEDLERIHRSKTGALLTGAVRMGVIAAGADRDTLDALDAYGRAVGLAFQIADDVLDVTGQSEVIGKTAGRDLDLDKATFTVLLGLDGARARARTEAEAGIAALRGAGRLSPALEALARFAVERDK